MIGRFTQEDTYYGDGLNLYAYCRNLPIGYEDSSGHICEKKYNALKDKEKNGEKLTTKEKKQIADYEKQQGKSGKNSTKTGFENWLNKGTSDNKVYFAIDENGNFIYTGITKQSKNARLAQHLNNDKPFVDLVVQYDGLTRNQARAIEQYFIEKPKGPNRENKIYSIRKKHRYYAEARSWAMKFLGV